MATMHADHSQRIIRTFQPAEAAEVTEIWHRSGRARFTYLPTWQTFTLEQARHVFDTVIQPRCSIWVATDSERVVAFVAMRGTYIDRLSVDPPEWRKGWGTELIKFAKQLCPSGLELHTHQANVGARAFYERHGFRAVKFGLSPAPESMPDVEYHWRHQCGYELVKVTTVNDWRDYHSLRRNVLWEARGRTGYDEKRPEEFLAANHPLLFKLDGRSIGTTRLDVLGDRRGVVRLVAIAAGIQRRGHGRALSALVESYAYRLGLNTLLVNAAPEAVGYYEKMGWKPCMWDKAELVGIAADCSQMTKALMESS